MNKVVRREVKAGDLPDDMRGDIDPSHVVEVTIRDLGVVAEPSGGWFSRYFPQARNNYDSVQDVVDHVRVVRDGER